MFKSRECHQSPIDFWLNQEILFCTFRGNKISYAIKLLLPFVFALNYQRELLKMKKISYTFASSPGTLSYKNQGCIDWYTAKISTIFLIIMLVRHILKLW